MAGTKRQSKAAVSAAKDQPPVAPAGPARETLTDKQLAKAVLARELRPRVGEIRRLAQAVLSRKGKGKKAKSDKLAKIPQKK